MKKQTKEATPSKTKAIYKDFVEAVVGTSKLAFLAADGVGAYVLVTASNSLELEIVAAALLVQGAFVAASLVTKK